MALFAPSDQGLDCLLRTVSPNAIGCFQIAVREINSLRPYAYSEDSEKHALPRSFQKVIKTLI